MYAHLNVENVCLNIMREKGWKLSVEGEYEENGVSIDPGTLIYSAEKDGFDLHGHNAIELLGLVAVYECVQPQENVGGWWWVGDEPDIRGELWEQAFGDPT